METRNYLTIVRENLVDFFIPSHIPGTWAYSAHEKEIEGKENVLGMVLLAHILWTETTRTSYYDCRSVICHFFQDAWANRTKR